MAANTNSSVTVGSTVGELVGRGTNGTNTNPRTVLITNTDAVESIYWGFLSTTSVANGTPLGPGKQIALNLNYTDVIYAIRGAAADVDVRIADLHP